MHEAQKAYADYLLGFPWQAYHTQTFKNTRNDTTNAVYAVWNTLSNKLGWTRGFLAAERHKLGGVHIHALLANDYDFKSWQIPATKKYCDKAFGFTHIESARNQATVNLYCAKYVVKDNGDYFFLGNTWDNPFWSSNPL